MHIMSIWQLMKLIDLEFQLVFLNNPFHTLCILSLKYILWHANIDVNKVLTTSVVVQKPLFW